MRDMPIDWNDLKVLLVLSRASSLAAAAKCLQVDQSTVSRRLANIEKVVGAQIFIRGSRENAWTGIGRKLVDAAEKAEAAIHNAQHQVRNEQQNPMGRVRVVVPSGLIPALLPYQAAALSGDGIDMAFIGAMEPLVDVHADADVVIRYSEPPAGDFIAHQVGTEEFGLYAAKNYAADFGFLDNLEGIASRRLIACELPYIAALREWSHLALRYGAANKTTLVDNLQSAEQLIRLGYGIGVLPTSQASSNPLLERISFIPFESQPIYLSYHVSLRKSARVQASLSLLRGALARITSTTAPRTTPNLTRESALLTT